MAELEGQLTQKRVQLELSPAARQWLAERGYDKTFGARPMARLIQEKIKRVLAEEMLFGQLKDGGKVEIDVAQTDSDDAELAFTYSPLPPSKLKKRQEETEPA
jgi:ATP-dependent Clp protease ATP-binding subunit ClpA